MNPRIWSPRHRAQRLGAHPSVRAVRARGATAVPERLTDEAVRAIALEAGANDAAVVSLDHPELTEEKTRVLRALPEARSLVAIVLRAHPDNIQRPRRSVPNLEFHRVGHEADEVAGRIALALSARGHSTIDTGEDAVQATVRIDDGTLAVDDGLVGSADIIVRTDTRLWLDIVTGR